MAWRHLNPAQVARELRAAVDQPEAGRTELMELALRHLRSRLLSGEYVVVQDDEGRTFIGTPEEASQHMMDGCDTNAH